VLGPTGVGKSYLASALAQKACRDGYAVYYTRAAALFRDLNLARADGSLGQLLKRLNRIDVLVIDDWAMAPLVRHCPRLHLFLHCVARSGAGHRHIVQRAVYALATLAKVYRSSHTTPEYG
jgi:hypothetical protein